MPTLATLVLSAALLLSPGTADVSRPAPEDLASSVERWADAWHERRAFNGIVFVAAGGHVVAEACRGQADLQRDVPLTPDTRFDIASLAKPFLAVVVLRLAEKGELDLDAAIGSYLEELRNTPAEPVTLRQLLAHTGGLIDHSDVPNYFTRARAGNIDRGDILEIVRTAALKFQPGEGYAYSNFGYSLLAMAAECATKLAYGRILEREIIVPAGLMSTRWNDVTKDVPNRAPGFERAFDGSIIREALVPAVADIGSGDILATAGDLWRFERALSTGKLLQPTSLREMFRNHAPVSPQQRGYGLGWEIYRTETEDGSASETFGHGGLSYGFVHVMERDPQRGTFFAILSNARPSDAVMNNIPPPDIRRMQRELRALLRGQPVPPARACLGRIFLSEYLDKGYDFAAAKIRRLRKQGANEFEFDPNAFMLAAYEISARGKTADAIRLTEFALETQPDSWLLAEALGDFHSELGQNDKALRAYRRAAAKMPKRDYLKARIEELSRNAPADP